MRPIPIPIPRISCSDNRHSEEMSTEERNLLKLFNKVPKSQKQMVLQIVECIVKANTKPEEHKIDEEFIAWEKARDEENKRAFEETLTLFNQVYGEDET